MKINIVRLIVLICLMPVIGFTQTKKLPAIDVKDLSGKLFNFSEVSNGGEPVVIVFWATWCKPCLKQLNNISEVYSDWQKETGVKLIAVSIDDPRSVPKVKPLVASKSWDYEVYLDENQDLKRAMSVNNVPYTFIVNGKGEIVWQHDGYNLGDEDLIFDKIRAVKTDKNPVKAP